MAERVIVTGAAGFIGSHVSERLIDEGMDVLGIDCLTDYYSPDRKRLHLRDLIKSDRFDFLERDLNELDLEEVLGGACCVFHLAAQAGVRSSWGAEFTRYVDSNILATQRLLEALKEHKEIKLIYSSSSSVYGDTKLLPMKEDHPLNPISPYGATKLSGEHLCELYHYNFGIRYVALRYFTVYGPRQRPDMAFSKFINSAFKGVRIEVYGDGRQTRDFTFVSDAVEANILAMKYDGDERIFNIGGGSRVSVLEVLDIIAEEMKTELDVKFIDREKGDVLDTWADTSRAKGELGFVPKVSLGDGIAEEIDWYRRYLQMGGGGVIGG
ncbi:MAG: hypothetical protein B6D63_01990 [Candidatus Latescibacteria bacterium 4484_7]|nr:MAG: hypothetical protein B6D63_01990 [Candidatus Latescibacteria bacterium 4484_7]